MTTLTPLIPLLVYVVFQRLAPREVPQRSVFAGLGSSKQSSRVYPNYRKTIRELELDAAPELVSWRGKPVIPGSLLTHNAGCNRSPRRLIVRADYIFPMAAPAIIPLGLAKIYPKCKAGRGPYPTLQQRMDNLDGCAEPRF